MAIQDKSLRYSLLNAYMKSMFRLALGKVDYEGIDNIPQKGAVILAPNHTNALIDALAVLTLENRPIVFVARADIFKSKIVANLLTFLKIMPIMRLRDGIDNLKKNEEVMRKSVEVLSSNIPFCIMSEGTHRPMHSLLPLVKGIFRIALQANEQMKGKVPVYIVPVGIEYGDFFRFQPNLLMNVGKPINVSDFVAENSNLEQPEMMMKMRTLLSERMQRQIHYVKDDEDYEAILDTSYICNEVLRADKRRGQMQVMLANRKVVAVLADNQERDNADIVDRIKTNARAFATRRRELGVADEDLYSQPTAKKIVFRISFLLCTLPYFIYSLIVSFIPVLGSEYLCKAFEDKAFNNSYRFGMMLIIMPIFLLLYTVILLSFCKWYFAFLFFIVGVFSFPFVYYYIKQARLVSSHIRMHQDKELNILKINILKDFMILKF